jgi:hypothetical protein
MNNNEVVALAFSPIILFPLALFIIFVAGGFK